MVQRAGLLVVAVLSAMVSLTGVAAAKEPDGYSCGTGGKRNLAKERCQCPKGKVARRDADNIAVCMAKAKTKAKTKTKPKTKVAKYLDDIVEIAGGDYHTCARTKAGEVSCWGRLFSTSTPFVVTGIGKATALAASRTAACAVVAKANVWCWGADRQPLEIVMGLEVVELAMGDLHSCVRTAAGDVYCWGDNASGQLGDASTTASSEPRRVAGLTDVVQLVSNYTHTCARTRDRRVWCWGDNAFGQLGDGTQTARSTPVLVDGLGPAVDLDVGVQQSCAAQANGRLACWGQHHTYDETPPRLRPEEIEGLSRIVEVSVGGPAVCVRSKRKKVRCWGFGEYNTEPGEPVAGLSSAVALEIGGPGCARLKNGEVRCWGGDHETNGDGKGVETDYTGVGVWDLSPVVAPPAK